MQYLVNIFFCHLELIIGGDWGFFFFKEISDYDFLKAFLC